LEHGNGRVDATAFLEKRTDGASGALGSNENDINVGWYVNLGSVLEDWGESVGEVESLPSLFSTRFYVRQSSLRTLPLTNWGLIAGHVSL
jgi:hypothetical protein